MYVPLDAPIKATSRTFAFGKVESAVERIAEAVVGETDGEVDGNQDGDGDNVDGTTSGDTVDSTRVEGTWLAEESQHTCQSRRLQNSHLPMPSKPPIQHAEHPFRPVRHQWQCRRVKTASINVSQMLKVEKTYLGCANATQPPANVPKRLRRVHIPRRQCG